MNRILALALTEIAIGACTRENANASAQATSQVATPPASHAPSSSPAIPSQKEDWVPLRTAHVDTSVRALMPSGERAHATTIIMLGGVCAHAGWVCDSSFEHAGDGYAFLCPQPTGFCADGTPTWTTVPGGNDAFIDAAVEAADKMYPHAFNFDDAILAGFSRGAWMAAQYAMNHKKYRKLLLSSIEVSLDPAKLRAHGVSRVLLTANDRDGTRMSLQANAEKLRAAGIAARFFGTGGGSDAHGFEPTEAWWKEARAWLESDEGNPTPPSIVSR